MKRSFGEFFVTYLIINFLVIVPMTFWIFYPFWPITSIGWLALVFIPLPVYALMEWSGSVITNKSISNKLCSNPEIKVSGDRVLYLLIVYSILIGIWVFFVVSIETFTGGFFETNFKRELPWDFLWFS